MERQAVLFSVDLWILPAGNIQISEEIEAKITGNHKANLCSFVEIHKKENPVERSSS